MRLLLAIGLTLLAVGVVAGAFYLGVAGPAPVTRVSMPTVVPAPAPKPAPAPEPPTEVPIEVPAGKPIPQDHARIEQRRRERLEWNRTTLQGAYDRVGKRDPRWDEPARKALDLAARMFSNQVDPFVSLADIYPSARQAIDAGCNDPLILYLYARTSVGPNNPSAEELTLRTRSAAEAMIASRYPPYRRAVAQTVLAEYSTSTSDVSPEAKAEAIRRLDAALDLLPESLKEDPPGFLRDEAWDRDINWNIQLRQKLGVEDRTAFEAVDARLAKVPGAEALRLAVRGRFFYFWGWKVRTNAFAFAVSEDQFQTFASRVQEARTALEAAWKLNHDQPKVAAFLLDIEKSIGNGDREVMETWFERAMTTDGDDEGACSTKLDWLDPKWHGGDSFDEMLAFGEACRATGNWRAGITLLDGDAHFAYWSHLPVEERVRYVRRPEVWSHLRSIYDEYLKHFPHDDTRRSKYAYFCFAGSFHHEAHAQFQALGDRLTTWTKFPNVPLVALKSIRGFTARVVSGEINPSNARTILIPPPGQPAK